MSLLSKAAELLEELTWLEQMETEYELDGTDMPDLMAARLLHLHNRRSDLQRHAFADALAESGQKVIDIFKDREKGFTEAAYQMTMFGQVFLHAHPRNIDRRRFNKRRAIAAHRARKAAR